MSKKKGTWGKATTTYKKVATKSKGKPSSTPAWFPFAITIAFFSFLCLVVNIRAFREYNTSKVENERLASDFENASRENSSLKEEISDLKSDSGTIEREARKIGMSRPNEKVLVPTN